MSAAVDMHQMPRAGRQRRPVTKVREMCG